MNYSKFQVDEDKDVHQTVAKDNQINTPKRFKALLDWICSVGLCIVVVLIIQNFIILPTVVIGDSMKSTLSDSERFFANRFIYYFKDPKAGDIITFHGDESQDYVKRVIAVGGQTVEIIDDELYVNSVLVEESYIELLRQRAIDEGRKKFMNNFGPYVVPDDEIFVMGDNRNNSYDSRDFGSITKDKIIGKAELVFWPLKDIRMP
ncbi:signal peptidase I [Paenibacillus sp. Leaf72]|uniref:signal peptidase I n=1 Tax=Paenibacillus sp. Leaf72 TaxID=1736234 RepID=UPI0006F6ADF2|nr:signal peptidase I [Paenibacillus sp. Leaf72]KQN96770.1 hypothetical protein ASF12_22110 [Paenibacillus sp. Leaf72]